MKKYQVFTLLIVFLVSFGCKNERIIDSKTTIPALSADKIDEMHSKTFGIVIHGGAGTILKKNMTDSLETAYREKLTEAVSVGYQILEKGGEAMDAVTATITIMEDSPLFNAGKGAVFTNKGKNELDASVMDGKTLDAGAVAGVTTVKNPINLAVEVMNNSPHVLLSGEGAEIFAREKGFEMTDPSYFYTQKRFQALQQVKAKTSLRPLESPQGDSDIALAKNQSGTSNFLSHSNLDSYDPYIKDSKYGTVGCVVLDKNGNLAAGTSTGGMTNKKWSRIGDAPIIGAGTYANNETCAVSSTGWGEYFMRGLVAYDISAMMEYKGISLKEATHEVIQNKLTKLGGTGGIVSIDYEGNVSMEFNTPGMYRAHMNSKGELVVKIFKD
jgi:beta-aspartyl-peptidase (threonine type)